MSKLVIVESPTKANAIGRFLGKNYKVIASQGHVRDLPKSQLGVDIENDFEPRYITLRGRGEILDKIRKEAKNADAVLLATDPDREGEAISWHLAHILKLNGHEPCRVEFHEITKKAVESSIKEPRALDYNLIDAQQARRVLDRLVGYKISPILWAKVRKGLSAGRVQSVATRIICDQEEEIMAFVPQEFWTITAMLRVPGHARLIESTFYGVDGNKLELLCEEDANAILKRVEGHPFVISDKKTSEKSRHAPAPFTTSSLQQETSRKLNITTKITMAIAQSLYEGVVIEGKGLTGLITYMRTDSVRVSKDAQDAAREHILNTFGSEYVPDVPNVYKGRANAQDAHEAIRPTYIELTPQSVKSALTPGQYKVYKLIYERFIASQMTDQRLSTTTVTFTANGCIFRSSSSKILFQGFSAVYTEGVDEKINEKRVILPAHIKKGDSFSAENIIPEQHFTAPPPRYTEASLVKLLEEKGIGRPSTYAPTIAAIVARGYVVREKKQLLPTELGFIVTKLMKQNFAQIVDPKFTADMEESLDKIEHGSIEWKNIVRDFYASFSVTLENALKSIEKINIPDEVSDVPCDKCGTLMVIKSGRFGKFLACPNYPECKTTKPLAEKVNVPCPKCGRDIVKLKTKKGKPFYGCEGYPDCDFTVWDRPINERCKSCGSIMVTRFDKPLCSNPDCNTTKQNS
ncbi:MAG: type I DNA topoisomerase [Clostridia bacterium]|nr:type I DNA topoisomerase [Clostridia bacterium]